MKTNYQTELDGIIRQLTEEGRRPSLLLHACCAPCSSYVLEYLTQFFAVTLFFYNPNIHPREEYDRRLREVEKLLRLAPFGRGVELVVGPYDDGAWFEAVRGREKDREGGPRCALCFEKRLEAAAQLAAERGADWFCTTLSISPHKNAVLLHEIGARLGEKYGVPFLPSDFKKRDGYKRSTELCAEYGIYRQNYCGCRYSIWFDRKEEDE